ncbi:nuclease-related domain-containing DEAD/DEAH box helicase [Micrococcus luteus]|uniref:nuclease-related domain-containing DEAD/DEAH box helicase n=1 Tax=Micrococcus luteus TaxID=1270 RepID=UPI001670825A|nr:nuclease-related domain-containing protein [Micrococcus luteus]
MTLQLKPPLSTIRERATSHAEVIVAERLAETDLGPRALAYWSVALAGHASKKEAEADFVIVHDDVMLVVEVKGGGIQHHSGDWYSIDRKGDVHALRESPVRQALGAGRALQAKVGQDNRYWVRWDACVITPDIGQVPDGLGWDPDKWLCGPDLTTERLQESLRRIIDSVDPAPHGWRGGRVQYASLVSWLDGTLIIPPSVESGADLIDELQLKATQDQAATLLNFETHQLVVTGGAGTGKSLTMVELARREAQMLSRNGEHQRVLVTFRSRGLLDFFTPLLEQCSNVDVVPFSDLSTDEKYDVVLVDEAQDLMNADDMDLLTQTVHGGFDRGRWKVFLDPNNQAHVDGVFDPDTFDLLRSQATATSRLSTNVRNTRPVVVTLQDLLEADLGDPGIVNGERPFWDRKSTGDLWAAIHRARDLVAEGVARDRICLIDCSRTEPSDSVQEGFRVVSPRTIKGLEAHHVVVFGLPTVIDSEARASLYVALTRPRISLSILATPEQYKALGSLPSPKGTRS